jgi:hypothetical protein
MRILFVISVLREGKGGHYHSLKHVSNALDLKHEVAVISIGAKPSYPVSTASAYLDHIYFNGISLIGFRKRIQEILNSFKPQIIHCFDGHPFNIFKLILNSKKYAFVVNQCGGMNPKTFPKIENLVLFSEENRQWFIKHERFDSTNIALIPNRVLKVNLADNKRIIKNEKIFNFVRISRIAYFHKESILGSIFLVERLHSEYNLKVKLYIIGAVYDSAIFNEIQSLIAGKDYFELITDDTLTGEASQLLYLADAVIATGRGVMEGASLGIPVLTPAKNSEIPILINRKNFRNFFNTNFSQRNKASKVDLELNIDNIISITKSSMAYEESSLFHKELFKEYFDVLSGIEKYIDVYNIALNDKRRVSRFSDFNIKIWTLLSFYRSSNKFFYNNVGFSNWFTKFLKSLVIKKI